MDLSGEELAHPSSTGAAPALESLSPRGPRWPRRKTAAFARRLAAHLEAGIPPRLALSGARPPAPAKRIARAESRLVAGESFADALAELRLFSPPSIAWFRAFEKAGRLAHGLERIASAIESDAALFADLLKRAAYPVLVLHFVPIALAVPQIGRVGVGPALFAVLWPWALGWAIVAAVCWWLCFRDHGSASARALLAVPGLGPLLRARSMQLYFEGAGALYGAGVPIAEAHAEARSHLSHRGLSDMLTAADRALAAGRTYHEAVGLTGALRPLELDHVETGERTGRLEATLADLARLARGDAELRARAAVRVLAGAIYALAVILVAWSVISFYAELYGGLRREFS